MAYLKTMYEQVMFFNSPERSPGDILETILEGMILQME